jgi:hypothetical protein
MEQNVETQSFEVSPVAQGSIWHHRKGFGIACLACLATTQYGKLREISLTKHEEGAILTCLGLTGMDYGLIGGLQAMPGFLKVFGYKDPTSPIGWGIDSTVQQLINSLMTAGEDCPCRLHEKMTDGLMNRCVCLVSLCGTPGQVYRTSSGVIPGLHFEPCGW